MGAKAIDIVTVVDLDRSRAIWADGSGDNRIAVWTYDDGHTVWIETNGDPVVDADDMRRLLHSRQVPHAAIEALLNGDIGCWLDGFGDARA